MMLKGKSVIELTDIHTGKKEHYEDTNLVTEAAMDDIRFVWLKARSLADAVVFHLQAESKTELSALSGLADTCTCEEGVWRFSLRIGKAGEQA